MAQISVIICTYNRSDNLTIVLDSILRSDISADVEYEIIIIDNNSTDNTKKVVERYCKQNKWIRYLFEERQGKSFALNTGIDKAKGEIIAFTDDDVILDKYWLKSIRQAFDEFDCSCFGGKVIPLWPEEVPNWLTKDGPFKISGGAIVQHDLGGEPKLYNGTTFSPPGANIFMKKEVFSRHGNFRTDISNKGKEVRLGEDFDFIYRLKKKGEKVMYYPKAIIYHPVHESKLNKRYFEQFWFAFGKARAIIEDLPHHTIYYLYIPRFIFKQFAINALHYLLAILRLQFNKAYYYKLKLYMNFGAFSGFLEKLRGSI